MPSSRSPRTETSTAPSTVAMTEARRRFRPCRSPAGTLSVSYINGAVSGSLTEFHAAYRGLADVTASASISEGTFSGEGDLALTVPGLKEASGKIRSTTARCPAA